MTRFLLLLFCGLTAVPAGAADKTDAQPRRSYKVAKHFFASGIHFDKEGFCHPVGKTKMKSWQVRAFPAEIPHFESCTIISSPQVRGEVDIELSIAGKQAKKPLLRIDGVLALGTDGKACQAVDWDHLVIPAAGLYHLTVKVDGRKIKRIPMRFSRRRPLKN